MSSPAWNDPSANTSLNNSKLLRLFLLYFFFFYQIFLLLARSLGSAVQGWRILICFLFFLFSPSRLCQPGLNLSLTFYCPTIWIKKGEECDDYFKYFWMNISDTILIKEQIVLSLVPLVNSVISHQDHPGLVSVSRSFLSSCRPSLLLYNLYATTAGSSKSLWDALKIMNSPVKPSVSMIKPIRVSVEFDGQLKHFQPVHNFRRLF